MKYQTARNVKIPTSIKYPTRLATGKMLTELTVRRPKVGDIRAVSGLNTEAEQEPAMMARITGLVPEDLDEFDMVDYKALQDFFSRSSAVTNRVSR
ncbi:phage tail assembly protein [Neisseria montereyensis]|uniref:Phage tail assembly protein n=1 Tax=Neisseria montereyensis TaxID=2973938 RepID=A0ABT2F998_9NEIS|nr:phage tail assembly protein [Neisseria montereyensis]